MNYKVEQLFFKMWIHFNRKHDMSKAIVLLQFRNYSN